MLHGNLLLHGWSLTDVTFYTTELPEYMLVELVRGFTSDAVHVAAALTYTLLVVIVGVLAKGNATGRAGLVRVLVASGILLAPSIGSLSASGVVLSNPDHTGTQVPLLLIWLILDRVRPRWWVPIVVTVLLAWVQVADAAALYEGVLPLLIVCGVRMMRRREPFARQWYEMSLGAGAILSAYVATRTLIMIRRAGGFAVSPPSSAFSSINDMSLHMWQKLQSDLVVFGANFFMQSLASAAVPLLHLVGVALVIWATARAIRRFGVEENLMVQIVTVAFFVLLAAFTFGIRSGAWEVVGLLPLGAVLAGRLLAEKLISTRLFVPLAAVLACYGLLLLHNATAPEQINIEQKLATWLEAHHLHQGLAYYFQANSVTLDSGDRVQVRAIRLTNGALVRTHWSNEADWYNPRRADPRFVILGRGDWRSRRWLFSAEGHPTRTYQLGGFLVMVWNKNLLRAPTVPAPFVPWNILASRSPPGLAFPARVGLGLPQV